MNDMLLDRRIEYGELVDAGALRLFPEDDVRKLFGPGPSRTVGELLKVPTHASRVVWAVMRERVLPGEVLRRAGLDLAERAVQSARDRGTYLDFRTERGLGAAREWLAGRISLGEFLVAAASADRARRDVAELGDSTVSATADIVCALLRDNAEEAFRAVFYLYIATHKSGDELAWVIERARIRIGEVPPTAGSAR